MIYLKQISLRLLIILFITPALIYARGSISGIVKDQNERIIGAEIIIYEINDNNQMKKIAQISTNSKGEFEYKNLNNGSYQISVIKKNYVIYNKIVAIDGKLLSKDNKTLIIKLKPKPITKKRNKIGNILNRFINSPPYLLYVVILPLGFLFYLKQEEKEKKEKERKRLKKKKERERNRLIYKKKEERKRLEKKREKERKRLEKKREKERKRQQEKNRRGKWSNELGEEWKKSKYAKLNVSELKDELSIRDWVIIYKPYNKKEYVIALMDDDANNQESAELRTKVIKQREKEEKRKKEARSKAAKKAAATRKAKKIKREKEELELIDNSFCQGSGFLVSDQGLVITAYHVIENSRLFFIRFPLLDLEFRGKVFLVDRNNDIAILKIPKTEFKKVYKDDIPIRHFKSVNARVGENVITFGYPFGEILGSSPKLTDGRISDTSGMNDNPTHYQITNPIQPGNSGGPLINKSGHLIGVVIGSMSDQYAVEISGAVPQNVNFAVKVEYLSQALQSKNIKVPVLKSTQEQQDHLPTEVIAEKIMPLVTQIRLPKEEL